MSDDDVRDRSAASSASAWVATAVGVAVKGYVVNASLGSAGDDERSVAARLPAVLRAGDTVEPERVAAWMENAGFCEVVLLPRQANGLVPMRARKPSIA